MVDRALIWIAIACHTLLALSFVLNDGPQASRVVFTLSATHGVHASDLPAVLLWLVGVSALIALWIRHSDPR